jgi:hypothetical protein
MWRNIEACVTKPLPQVSQLQRYTTFLSDWTSADASGPTIKSEQIEQRGMFRALGQRRDTSSVSSG